MSLNADWKEQFFCVLVSFFLNVPIVSPGPLAEELRKRRLLKMQKISLLILCWVGHFLSFIHPLFPRPVRIACVAGATVGYTSSFLPSRVRVFDISPFTLKIKNGTCYAGYNTEHDIEATNVIKIDHIYFIKPPANAIQTVYTREKAALNISRTIIWAAALFRKQQ